MNDLRVVLETGKNGVCATEDSDYRGACLYRHCTFLEESVSEKANVFSFEQEEIVNGTENHL